MLGILRQKVGAGSSSAMILGQRIRPAVSAMRGFASSAKETPCHREPESVFFAILSQKTCGVLSQNGSCYFGQWPHHSLLVHSEGEEISDTDIQDQDKVPIKLLKRKSSPTSSKTDFAPCKKKN